MKMNLILCALFSTLIFCVSCELLQLKSGVINGTVGKSRNGRLFQQFYSIPYAEPPTGELRFKAPIEAKSWSGIKDATILPPACIQIPTSDGPNNTKEDCLYLNVFVPNDLFKPSGKATVMVWIHGGSYQVGFSADYSPEYFMDEDVILVTVNYRLGVLGFLGLNNDVFSGNFGLKDQVLALKWVKENIAVFGGNSDQVTVMGESAGSSSVHLHMFSPLSKGLFQKAIMQSGSAFTSWALSTDGTSEAVSTAFLVISGCWRNDSIRILKCLENIPASDFPVLENRLYSSWKFDGTDILFKPFVESNVKNQPFLPKKPATSSYQQYIPWITGMNSAEGAMGMASRGGALENVTEFDNKFLVSFLRKYIFLLDPEYSENKTQKIIDFYFKNAETKKSKILKLVDIFTDFGYLYPLIKTVQSTHLQQYVYLYDHRGSFSGQDDSKLDIDLGVAHADELPLLFRWSDLEAKWNPQDKLVSETLVKLWTEFAKTGDPNGASVEKSWKPTGSKGDIEYLRIKSNGTTSEKNLFKERYEFWESLLRI
ncbi:juvenile hormone esterase-like isoform X2 [Planococcus citri]|uniref:juvenile hormone esterase-like isoform X2 n=1 Tax=Planococcus citri TaxID=170843 RepID=UPI0031F7D3D3